MAEYIEIENAMNAVRQIIGKHMAAAVDEIYEKFEEVCTQSLPPDKLVKFGNKVLTVEEYESRTRGNFGRNLKRICKENGIILYQVAQATETPTNTIYNITKRGTRKPRGDLAERVLAYLQTRVDGITMDDLFGGGIAELVKENNNDHNNENKDIPERT